MYRAGYNHLPPLILVVLGQNRDGLRPQQLPYRYNGRLGFRRNQSGALYLFLTTKAKAILTISIKIARVTHTTGNNMYIKTQYSNVITIDAITSILEIIALV
jgi:hypothetical protein